MRPSHLICVYLSYCYFSYKQCFDLEGESGIVIRGIGTAVTLAKLRDPQVSPLGASPLKE
jgi:hypothetical protein